MIDAEVREAAQVVQSADAAAGRQLDVGPTLSTRGQQSVCPRTLADADTRQIENDRRTDADIDRPAHDRERIAIAPHLRGKRNSRTQVEREDKTLRPAGSDRFREFIRAGKRFQTGNDAFDARLQQRFGILAMIQAGINPQRKTVVLQRLKKGQGGRMTGDGVEIGEIKDAQTEAFAKRTRDRERIAHGRERTIFMAAAGDAANDMAGHEIENGEDAARV